MREPLKALIALTISVATLMIILHISNFEVSLTILTSLDFKFVLIASFLQFSFWFLWALRLKFIAKTLGCNIRYRYSLITTLSSMFFAAITPSSAGGEPVRVKMIGDVCGSYGVSSAVVLIERLLDAVFFALSLPILVILAGFYIGLGFKVGGIFSISLSILISILYTLLRNPSRIETLIVKTFDFFKRFSKSEDRVVKLKGKTLKEAMEFRKAMIDVLNSKINAFLMMSLTVVMWVLGFLIPSFILLAMHQPPYYLLSLTAQVIIVVVSLIPLTPGSSGIAEGTMAYLYSTFVPSSVLGVLVTIWRLITYYTNLLLGFVVSFKVVRS